MVGRGPFRRRGLVIDAFATGEPATDDFLRCELLGMTTGELTLDPLPLDRVVLLLMVRSRSGATKGVATAGAVTDSSSSGNREYQFSVLLPVEASLWNSGDVSKLSEMKGEGSISGVVMFVKAAEGGADWNGSTKMSLGEIVCVELGTEWGLMAVKALAGASQGLSCWRPAKRLAPESKELLLFKSGLRVSFKDRGAKAG